MLDFKSYAIFHMITLGKTYRGYILKYGFTNFPQKSNNMEETK